jgi:ABC-type nitrate/sulfonate/bicarbonate transport system permease component
VEHTESSDSSLATVENQAQAKNKMTAPLRFLKRQRGRLNNILSIVIFLVAWELFSRFGELNINLFPPPSWVSQELGRMVQSGMLGNDVMASIKRSFSGFFLGSLIAITLGLLTGRIQFIRGLLEPVIQLFRPIPSIAFVPLSIFWFGLGEASKLFLITYGVFFPVWLNTHVGVSTVDPLLIRAARSLGAKGRSLFLEVVLPASMPFIMAGLRQGIAVAFIVLVAAEMTGARAGLGFRIEESHELFRADRMLVGLLALGVLGGLSDLVFAKLSERIVFWTGEAQNKR